MKLRLKQNTIRIRLAPDEVKELSVKGFVQSQTRFTVEQSLKYHINLTESKQPSISFSDHIIVISVPTNEMNGWYENDLVGFSWNINLDGKEQVSLLIEKDFQCLTVRPGEDESNLYENPNQTHA